MAETRWQDLATLLPMIVAGAKGGPAGVGGFSQGWTGTRQWMDEQARADQARQAQEGYRREAADLRRSNALEQEQTRKRQQAEDLIGTLQRLVPEEAIRRAEAGSFLDPAGAADLEMENVLNETMQALESIYPGHGLLPGQVLPLLPKPGASIKTRRRTAMQQAYDRLKASGTDLEKLRAGKVRMGELGTVEDIERELFGASLEGMQAKKPGTRQLKETSGGFAAWDPETNTMEPVQGGFRPPLTAAERLGAGEAPPLVGIGTALGEAALEGLSAGEQSVVRRLVNYQQQLPSGMALRTPYWQKLLERASLYDPAFDQKEYNNRQRLRGDFTSGKAAFNIRSLNTAVGHLGSLAKSAQSLGNSSLRFWNAVKNSSLTAVGDPRVKTFLATANAVAGELATVFKGTAGTDQEIKSWREVINESDSPEQLRAVVDAGVELLASRLDALTSQYLSGMGKPKDFYLLNKKSRTIISDLGLDVDAHDPVTGEPLAREPVTTAAAAARRALKNRLNTPPERK